MDVNPAPAALTVQAHLFRDGQAQQVPPDLDALTSAIAHSESFIWLDITGPTAEYLLKVQQAFDLHPLAIEDALHAHQRAKVETYPHFWFVVVHSAALPSTNLGPNHLETHETALFIGPRYIITCQYHQAFPAQEIITRWELVPEAWRYNGSSLMYVYFDYLVDGFGPLADQLEQELREVRTWLASGKAVRPEMLRRIFALEEITQEAYAVAMTLRDILPPFVHAVEDAPVGGAAEAPYYRDVHDHAIGVVERLATERDMSKRAFDVYQSLAAQQQGAVARQLTIVATIFLPLTFLTGFFGQNFDYLVKHIESERAFLLWGVGSYVLSVIVILLLVRVVARD